MIAAAPLAGRLVELRAVLDAVEGADGTSAGALVTGEAGIGKSRLVTEAAAAADVAFITGWCLHTLSGLPFLPIVDVLRGLHRLDDGDGLATALGRCPGFVRDDLAVLLPELGSRETVDDVPLQGWRRHRLFDSIRRLLDAVSQQVPFVVVIEDVHWADSSTLELCDYLLASGRTTVPVILTCRADEMDLPTVETFMNRGRLFRVELAPLTRSQTRDQLIGLLGASISEGLVDEIYRRAGGNAFFTEQLASAADDRPGAPLPTGLRAVLVARIRDAEPDERAVLAAMAMSGRALTEPDLGRVCGWTMLRVRASLHGLVERRLVNADPSGFTLRHVLLGEAVSARLLAGERAELHLSLGEMLAVRGEPSRAAATAEHFLQAQRPGAELLWRMKAAQYAESVLAPAEALQYWRRVIALWDTVDAPALVINMALSEVYRSAASVADLAGRRSEAVALGEQALTLCDVTATALQRAQVLRTLGDLHFPADLERATQVLSEADQLYRMMPPHREHAWTLQQLALTLFRKAGWNHSELAALLERTLEIAERCAAPGVAIKSRAQLAFLAAVSGDPGSAATQIEEVLALEPDPGDPERTAGAFGWATSLLVYGLASFDRCAEVGRAALDWIAEHGYVSSFNANVIGENTLTALLELGRIDEAAVLQEQIWERNPLSGGDVWSLVDRSILACARGRLKEALDLWDLTRNALSTADETPFTGGIYTCGVEILVWAGVSADAARLAVAVLEPRVEREESRECGQLFSLGVRAAADMAVRGRLLAEPDSVLAAQKIARQLDDLLAQCRLDPFDQSAMPATSRCDHLNWIAERGRLAGDNDVEAWAAATSGWEHINAPVRAGYSRYRQGEAELLTPGARSAATMSLRQALRSANQHVPLINAISGLARRAGLSLAEPAVERAPSSIAESATPSRLAALTARELAVLSEIAGGKTNAQIGATLFMSPKTASVHVTNILRKLEIRSRAQAAAIAAESGLSYSGKSAG